MAPWPSDGSDDSLSFVSNLVNYWLVIWNIWIFFPIILGMECHHPN